MDSTITLLFLAATFVSSMPAPLEHTDSFSAPTRSFNSDNSRLKRSYFPFTANPIYSHKYEPISVYKPPMYALSRPYYVPVFGASGRVPIYFPPQPLSAHFPDDDNSIHKKPFKGPTYLPPVTVTPPASIGGDKVNMTFVNRFKDMEDDEDRAPIWGVVKIDQKPPAGGSGVTPGVGGPPTRPPPSGTSTVPPLVHANPNQRPGSQSNQIYFDNNSPSAVMLHVESGEQDEGGQGGAMFAPPAIPTAVNTVAPAVPPVQPAKEGSSAGNQDSNSPGPCVWAIISCCSAASDQIRYNCFEQRGCGGAFWGVSPCDSELAQSAIAAALNYYNSN